ncbi:hypothetical protein NS319_16190 [Sphingomonas sanguinis]|uniref:Uncharacterized protein n=1 Tax=Sphingomonas sanguinis TaxID=33051 RepID=A0A147HSU3_9SPHN|nr:hypothetical protein NS319_16190 [Sphingomonas sanguinis]
MFVVLLIQAPPSQELEPPANPGRFNPPSCEAWIFDLMMAIRFWQPAVACSVRQAIELLRPDVGGFSGSL